MKLTDYYRGQRQKYKSTAWLEAKVYKLVEILDEQRQATKENVQRRQARTDAEREEEGDDNVSGKNHISYIMYLCLPGLFV